MFGQPAELDEVADSPAPRSYPDATRPDVSASFAEAHGGGAVLSPMPIGGRVDGVLLRALSAPPGRAEVDRTHALAVLLGARLGEARGRSALRAAHGALNRLTAVVGDAVVISTASGVVAWANDHGCEVFGAPSGSLTGHQLDALLPGIAVDDERWEGQARPVVGGPRDVVVESRTFVDGDPTRAYVHLVHSTVELEDRRAMLAGIVDVDLDTGLPNHAGLLRAVEAEVALARKYNAFCSVLVVEVPNLPQAEARLEEPEDLLRAIGEAMGRAVRRSDTVARLPAGRFGLLLSRGSREQARALAPKLVKLVASASALAAGLAEGLTCTVGMAQFPDDGDSPDDVLGSAFAAARQAREQGKRWAFFAETDEELRSAEVARPGALATGGPVQDVEIIAQVDDLFEVEAGSASMSVSGTYAPFSMPASGDHATLSGPMPLRPPDPDETPSGLFARPTRIDGGHGEILTDDSSELLLALGGEGE